VNPRRRVLPVRQIDVEVIYEGISSGLGTTLAILFAPNSGEATRRRIKNGVANWNAGPSRKGPVRDHYSGKTGDEQKSEHESSGSKNGQGTAVSSQFDSINVLSRDELMTVNGIGPVLADRIISGRPYASRQELVDRGIIGKTTLEELERQFGSQKKRA
jgi:hypothetical protein